MRLLKAVALVWLAAMHTQAAAPWLGLAFQRAKLGVPRDHVIATLTWGPFVHTELLLAKGDGDVRAYAAFEGRAGFSPSARKHGGPDWVVLRFALAPGGYERAYALMLQLVALGLPYNSRDLWQCCVKVALPFEQDLDCERPDSWRDGGVFCSQAALLVVRRLARAGVVPLSTRQRARVEDTNSRGCSPNALFALLASPRPPHQKKT
jgi:hypothetical protein